jgi:hypothetical protein
MSRYSTALQRRRAARASLRSELAVRRAMAAAPTVESAHEIASAASRR